MEARGRTDFTTPNGNVIRTYGVKGSGEEYVLGKGRSSETIDEIIANPVDRVPSSRGDTSTGGRHSATILFGRSGDWVLVNDVGQEIIGMNDKFIPQQKPPYYAPSL